MDVWFEYCTVIQYCVRFSRYISYLMLRHLPDMGLPYYK
jgi:hypothetical protein